MTSKRIRAEISSVESVGVDDTSVSTSTEKKKLTLILGATLLSHTGLFIIFGVFNMTVITCQQNFNLPSLHIVEWVFYWLKIVRTIKGSLNGFYFPRSVTIFITAMTSRYFMLVDKENSPLCSLINMRCYLEAHFTLERLHAWVYVRMLLEPWRRGKRLATLGTSVRTGANVVRSNVAL